MSSIAVRASSLRAPLLRTTERRRSSAGSNSAASCERLRELDPQLLVVRVGSKLSLEIGEVMAARCLESGGGLEPVDLCVRNQTAEHDQCFLRLAAIDEE